MSDSRTAAHITIVLSALNCLVLGVVAILLMATNQRLDQLSADVGEGTHTVEAILEVSGGVGWEYDVISIPDGAWATDGKKLGMDGWQIVSARRASDAADNFAYECIVRRPFTPAK